MPRRKIKARKDNGQYQGWIRWSEKPHWEGESRPKGRERVSKSGIWIKHARQKGKARTKAQEQDNIILRMRKYKEANAGGTKWEGDEEQIRQVRGNSYSVVYKDSGFYFEREGILNHQRVLSRGETQSACILTWSLWFLWAEKTAGKRDKTGGPSGHRYNIRRRENGAMDPGSSTEYGAQYSDSKSISKVGNVY